MSNTGRSNAPSVSLTAPPLAPNKLSTSARTGLIISPREMPLPNSAAPNCTPDSGFTLTRIEMSCPRKVNVPEAPSDTAAEICSCIVVTSNVARIASLSGKAPILIPGVSLPSTASEVTTTTTSSGI